MARATRAGLGGSDHIDTQGGPRSGESCETTHRRLFRFFNSPSHVGFLNSRTDITATATTITTTLSRRMVVCTAAELLL